MSDSALRQDILTTGSNGHPFCTKCGRHVDEYGLERALMPAPIPDDPARSVYTGEIIFIVKCHGEVFKMSNWHGEMR